MAAVLPPQSNNDRSCDSTNNDAIHARRIRALEMAQRPKMPTPACLVDSKKKCILQTSDFDEVDEYIKLVRSSTLESDGQKVIDIMTPGMKDGYGNPFLTFIDEPIRIAIEKALSRYADVVPEIYQEISELAHYMASGMVQFFEDLKTLNGPDFSGMSQDAQLSCKCCVDLFLNGSQSRFVQAQGSITTLQKGLVAFEQELRPAQDRLIDAQNVISQKSEDLKNLAASGGTDSFIYFVIENYLKTFLDPTTQSLTDLNVEWTIALLHVEMLEGAFGVVLDDLGNVIAAVKDDAKDTLDVILDIDRDQLINQWDDLKKEVDRIRGTDTPDRVFGYANSGRVSWRR